jgi:excisionase family DNA binding protein
MGTKEKPKPAQETGEPRLVTAKELSAVLNVPRNTIYANAKKFSWPCYRVGADIRFDLAEIMALIRQGPP